MRENIVVEVSKALKSDLEDHAARHGLSLEQTVENLLIEMLALRAEEGSG
ncbi:hypothetical protein [Pontiella desulfatans]|nr:hypothetical protein [Pontiella desulfatans]